MRGRRALDRKSRTAVGYIRVSTEGQVSEGVSLQAQRAKIEAWASAHDCALGDVHVDAGLSGGRADNRPALQAALAQVCRGRGALVVYSLSRLARSTRDAIAIADKLDKAGADLVSLSESIDTTSATGKMVFRMLAVLAEFERDVIAERTRNAMGYKRAMGERISRFPPFGFALRDGGLIPNSMEVKAAKRARSLRAKGLSVRAVTEALNREKVPCRGRCWHLATVHGILSVTQLPKRPARLLRRSS